MQLLIIILTLFIIPLHAQKFTKTQIQEIGKKIWYNECKCSIEGLTSWNEGEDFASVGLGHFLWCPKGKACLFAETFPSLLQFMHSKGIKLPSWLKLNSSCPWNSRAEFHKNINSPKMKELRQLLAQTLDLQTEFIIKRLNSALPTMLKSLQGTKQAQIKKQFLRLEKTPQGTFALIDYINFKGEGSSTKERYKGHGWGLLNVLETMKGTTPQTGVQEFVHCAKQVLAHRVENAPAQRNEKRWLPGWNNRLDTYLH